MIQLLVEMLSKPVGIFRNAIFVFILFKHKTEIRKVMVYFSFCLCIICYGSLSIDPFCILVFICEVINDNHVLLDVFINNLKNSGIWSPTSMYEDQSHEFSSLAVLNSCSVFS